MEPAPEERDDAVIAFAPPAWPRQPQWSPLTGASGTTGDELAWKLRNSEPQWSPLRPASGTTLQGWTGPVLGYPPQWSPLTGASGTTSG